jgi:hypothetical protein
MWIMFAKSWNRRIAKTLKSAALAGGLACASTAAFAQSAAPLGSHVGASKKTYTKNTTFNLPIQMEDGVRANLKEVRLYVKSGSMEWVQHDAVPPTAPSFTCQAPSDGEYWFMLVTIDKNGKQTPSEIPGQPPALRVVVDTRSPALEPSIAVDNGKAILRVNVVDANPDPQSIRAVAMTELGERSLPALSGQPGAFLLSASDAALPIRVTASDLCGNQASRDVAARELMPALPPAAFGAALPPVAAPNSLTPIGMTAPAQAYVPPPLIVNSLLPRATPPASSTTPTASAAVPMPLPTPPAAVVNTAYRSAPLLESVDKQSTRKSVNTAQGTIEYRIDASGPADVGRVDLYLTPDRGQTWTKISENFAPLDETKKIISERDELKAQLAERSKEAADLRAQLAARTQERNQLAQDLQQYPRDLQALLQRMETSLNVPPTTVVGETIPTPRRPE